LVVVVLFVGSTLPLCGLTGHVLIGPVLSHVFPQVYS
jgi:hypothetical protein